MQQAAAELTTSGDAQAASPPRRRRTAANFGESRASTARRRANNRAAMARYRIRAKTQGAALEAQVESLTSQLDNMGKIQQQEATLRRENEALKLALAQCPVADAVRPLCSGRVFIEAMAQAESRRAASRTRGCVIATFLRVVCLFVATKLRRILQVMMA